MGGAFSSCVHKECQNKFYYAITIQIKMKNMTKHDKKKNQSSLLSMYFLKMILVSRDADVENL